MVFRVVQISDNHLSARHGYARPNWEATLAHLQADPADLVISTGDLVVDDPDEHDTRAFARARFDELPCPWQVVPGNHDIGDGPPTPWQDQPVTQARIDAFVETWGADRFVRDVEGWRLVGCNGIVMGSDLHDRSDEQLEWLERQLAGAQGRKLAVFSHKPIHIHDRNEPESSMAMPASGRAAMLELLDRYAVALVATGHLHDFRVRLDGPTTHLWCPTTAFVAPGGDVDDFGGVRQTGLVELDFDDHGVSWRLRRPAGGADYSIRHLTEPHGSVRFSPELPWEAVDTPEAIAISTHA